MSASGVVLPLRSSFLPLLFLIVLIAPTSSPVQRWRVLLTCYPIVLSVFQSLIIVCVGSTVWVQSWVCIRALTL